MKILALDTTSSTLSVALLHNNQILAKNTIYENGKQAELLIPEIEKILTQNKIWYQDLDLIAATNGPGSFTGTRIGLTVARTLKIATNLPLMLLNSCEVIAYKYRECAEKIFVVLDARADEFFYAEFERQILKQVRDDDGGSVYSYCHPELVSGSVTPQLSSLDDLENILPTTNFFLCGSGKKIAAKILSEKNVKFEMSEEEDVIEADLVGLLALEKFGNSAEFSENLDPIYLRSPRISERKK